MNKQQTPSDNWHEDLVRAFQPSAAQQAEFEMLRAGYFAERRHNRLVVLKIAAIVGGAVGLAVTVVSLLAGLVL